MLARAETCPKIAGEVYGPSSWAPDESADEKTYYRYVTDTDYARLDSIFYCLDAATQKHLQGFVMTFEETETEEKQAFPYGEVNTGDDFCTGFYVRDEINFIKIKQDDDDIEGIVIGNIEGGSMYKAMPNDMTEPDSQDSPLVELPGRLIGFGVTSA